MNTLYKDDLENEKDELEAEIEYLTSEYEELCDELVEIENDEEATDEEYTAKEIEVKTKEREIESWKDDNQERLDDLTQCLKTMDEYGGDSLINEDDFTDYVQDMANDTVGDIPHWLVIDWEATAENVAMDYTVVEFEGETWYMR
jgi:chromosome segregation ATPase